MNILTIFCIFILICIVSIAYAVRAHKQYRQRKEESAHIWRQMHDYMDKNNQNPKLRSLPKSKPSNSKRSNSYDPMMAIASTDTGTSGNYSSGGYSSCSGSSDSSSSDSSSSSSSSCD